MDTPPATEPVKHEIIADIDLTESSAEIAYEWNLIERFVDLPAGSYHLDAILALDSNEGTDAPETGDLMIKGTLPITVPEQGDVTQDIVFDRAFHNSVFPQ